MEHVQRDYSGRIAQAPWSKEECANIERYQRAKHWHPLTCVTHSDTPMIVRTDKMLCPFCEYVQVWVPFFVADQGPPLTQKWEFIP